MEVFFYKIPRVGLSTRGENARESEGVNSWQNLALSMTQGLGGKKEEGEVLVAREQDGIRPNDVFLQSKWFSLMVHFARMSEGFLGL